MSIDLIHEPDSKDKHERNVVAIEGALKELNRSVSELQLKLTDVEANNQENYRAKYADTGNWARHYSTVRMTVATFTLTTCVAIVALRPDVPAGKLAETVLANSVCLLWLMGLVIFYVFTLETYKSCDRQMRAWVDLPLKGKDKHTRVIPKVWKDIAGWVLLFLNSLVLVMIRFGDVDLPVRGGMQFLMLVASCSIFIFMVVADAFIQARKGCFKDALGVVLLFAGPVLAVCVYLLYLLGQYCD